jgi:hypothetical protein
MHGRFTGYEDVIDADQLGRDPAMGWIVGSTAVKARVACTEEVRPRHGQQREPRSDTRTRRFLGHYFGVLCEAGLPV